jgi:hypothetical protein
MTSLPLMNYEMIFGYHEKYNITSVAKTIVKSNEGQNHNYTALIHADSLHML